MVSKTNVCSKCGLKKSFSNFPKSKQIKRGFDASCKECNRKNINIKTSAKKDLEPIKAPYCIINGKPFQRLKDVAKFYEIEPNTVCCRMRDGWTLEEALGVSAREKSKYNGIDIVVKGIKYKSVKAASEAHGLNYKCVHYRLKNGYSLEQAFLFEDFDYSSKPKKLIIEGKPYESLRDACRYYGIDKDVLSARINRYGWTVEQALGVDKRPGYEEGIVGYVYLITNKLNGKGYVGITMGTIEARFEQHIEKAFSNKHISSESLHYAINQCGVESFEVLKLAKAEKKGELNDLETKYVLELNTLAPDGYNLNQGGAGLRTKGVSITVRGEKFPSITAACRKYNLDRRMTTTRLSKGMSFEEIIGKYG